MKATINVSSDNILAMLNGKEFTAELLHKKNNGELYAALNINGSEVILHYTEVIITDFQNEWERASLYYQRGWGIWDKIWLENYSKLMPDIIVKPLKQN